MSALAEALVAAQRRSVSALEKAHVGGHLNEEALRANLNAIGLNDQVDQDRLVNCLSVLREFGAALPAEPTPPGEPTAKTPEPASDAQLAFIARLVSDAHVTGPDLPLTKEQAHEVIDSLKAGTYDAAKWTIPF